MSTVIPCRAQTPGEKRAVIERLYAAWLAAPELRLGQLLVNAVLPNSASETAMLFHIEDTVIGSIAEEYAARHGRNPR